MGQGMEQAAKVHRLKNQASEIRIEELSSEAKELEAQMKQKTQEYADLEVRAAALSTERQAGIARISELVEKNKDLEGMLKAERQQRETVQKASSEDMGLEHVGLE